MQLYSARVIISFRQTEIQERNPENFTMLFRPGVVSDPRTTHFGGLDAAYRATAPLFFCCGYRFIGRSLDWFVRDAAFQAFAKDLVGRGEFPFVSTLADPGTHALLRAFWLARNPGKHILKDGEEFAEEMAGWLARRIFPFRLFIPRRIPSITDMAIGYFEQASGPLRDFPCNIRTRYFRDDETRVAWNNGTLPKRYLKP